MVCKGNFKQAQWHVPVILPLERLRQEDNKSDASLKYTDSLRTAWGTY